MTIENLKLIEGFIEGERFVMRGFLNHAVFGTFKAEDLLSMARLIHEQEKLNIVIDKEKIIEVPIVVNARLKEELIMIAISLKGSLN